MNDTNQNNKTETEQTKHEKSVSLLDLFLVIITYRKFIIFTTFIGAVVIFLFSIYTLKMPQNSPWNPLPNYYKSIMKIQIIDTSKSSSSLQYALSNSSSLTSLLTGSINFDPQSMILAKELLYSNSLIDAVIEKHNILERYKDSKFPITAARDSIKSAMKIETTGVSGLLKGTNILYISFQSLDPFLATEILNTVLIKIEEAIKFLTIERILNTKTFIEQRLEKVSADIEIEKAKLIEFQKKYGIIDLSVQARQQSNLIAELWVDVVKKELEIHTLKGYLSDDDPKIKRIENETEKIEQLIEDLNLGTENYTVNFIPQDDIPELTVQFVSLQREVAVLESIYTLLRREYEMVKIELTDNSKIFQIIQAPEIPENKAGPSRTKLCVYFTIVIFFFSIFLSFIREYLKRVKKDPTESWKLEQLKNAWRRKSKKIN